MRFKDYIKQFGVIPTIKSPLSFGARPSRLEIETAILEAGYALPSDNISFIIEDDDTRCFFITYVLSTDTYFYKKLSKVR